MPTNGLFIWPHSRDIREISVQSLIGGGWDLERRGDDHHVPLDDAQVLDQCPSMSFCQHLYLFPFVKGHLFPSVHLSLCLVTLCGWGGHLKGRGDDHHVPLDDAQVLGLRHK